MTADDPGSDPLGAHLALMEGLSVPACLWDGQGSLVAGNGAARTLWQGNLAEPVLGFATLREPNGAVWAGWRPCENPESPRFRLGQRLDGSRVEFLSFPSLVPDPSHQTAGIFEILFPLSAATAPRSLMHDLTNVVGIVLGNADLALMELPPGHELVENLEEIRTAALHAREIIRGSGPSSATPAQETPKTPVRVLWIDDDEAFLLLVNRALPRLGCEVRTYVSPDEALASYGQNSEGWDLVAIDNNLLGRDGLDVARHILRRNSRQRICLASGAVDEELETRAREIGVHRVITKPATVPEFALSLGDLLARPTPPPGLP